LLHKYEAENFLKLANKDKIEHFFSQVSYVSKAHKIEALVLAFPYCFDNIDSYDLSKYA